MALVGPLVRSIVKSFTSTLDGAEVSATYLVDDLENHIVDDLGNRIIVD